MATENKFQKPKFPIFIIALVWICNGLFCKILNLVPRHQEIVSVFFGKEAAREMTLVIGFLEILMAVWIVSGIKSKWNTVTQIIIIGLMNILEFIFASDLLLWGKMNIIFACIFIIFLYYQEFRGLKNKQTC
ncbi:DoxX-like family protein [Flavobacterium amniphilum]|uniref:DoxX-like family protein n=1 Tax=Flavobacterium amniphilum TaxID=1834035 RepID=UPI00202A16FD|nr:DoxX-like family protein [Flavobacterium amniphilum]MCL9805218.1 DoxX-like family protein [Flavobacterium amniphilum]